MRCICGIDIHAHVVPMEFPARLSAAGCWLPSLRGARAAHEERLAAMAAETSLPMHPAALAAALAAAVGQAMPADALAVYDGGHTTFWSNARAPAACRR